MLLYIKIVFGNTYHIVHSASFFLFIFVSVIMRYTGRDSKFEILKTLFDREIFINVVLTSLMSSYFIILRGKSPKSKFHNISPFRTFLVSLVFQWHKSTSLRHRIPVGDSVFIGVENPGLLVNTLPLKRPYEHPAFTSQ